MRVWCKTGRIEQSVSGMSDGEGWEGGSVKRGQIECMCDFPSSFALLWNGHGRNDEHEADEEEGGKGEEKVSERGLLVVADECLDE